MQSANSCIACSGTGADDSVVPFIDIYKVSFRESDSREKFAGYNSSRSSSLKLLFSVDMLNEGIHVVDVDGIVLF